jgi:hypothetical protein
MFGTEVPSCADEILNTVIRAWLIDKLLFATCFIDQLVKSEFQTHNRVTRVAIITTGSLDFVHHLIFWRRENAAFRELDLFPSSCEKVENFLHRWVH